MTEEDIRYTKCKKDYYGSYYWEKIGTDGINIIYHCTQCEKCIKEPIEWLEDCDDLEMRDYGLADGKITELNKGDK